MWRGLLFYAALRLALGALGVCRLGFNRSLCILPVRGAALPFRQKGLYIRYGLGVFAQFIPPCLTPGLYHLYLHGLYALYEGIGRLSPFLLIALLGLLALPAIYRGRILLLGFCRHFRRSRILVCRRLSSAPRYVFILFQILVNPFFQKKRCANHAPHKFLVYYGLFV
jgi:hypothetical protein